MRSIKFIFLFICINISYAQVELQTKQAINKIRYITKDGKITYYQKNSGEFQMSTNYSFATVIKKEKNTQYLAHASSTQKRLAIEVDATHFSHMNLRKNHEIYVALFGKKGNATKIADGVNPQLHLEDQWLSYYDLQQRIIYFHNFSTDLKDKKKRTIKMSHHLNPYHIPDIVMLTPNDVLYTDINKSGHMALLLYSFVEGSFTTVYKTKKPGNKIDYCTLKNKIIIGEFPFNGVQSESAIVGVDIFNNKFKNFISYYSSKMGDLGNLKCLNKKVYFIKTISKDNTLNDKNTEVASLDLASKEIKIESKLEKVSQITVMGEKLIASRKGKYYLIYGQNTTQSDKISEEGEE